MPVLMAPPASLYALFADAAARVPDRPAIQVQRRDRLDTYDYASLRDMAERAAGTLAARDCRAGARCAILADNDARWCASYLGILRLGAVAVPLDTAYRPAQIRTLLADSGATIVFVSLRFLPGLQEAIGSLNPPPAIILLEGTAPGLASLDDALSGPAPAGLAPCATGPSDTAVILYTSGTTSDPKGVVLTNGNMLAEREGALRIVDLNERDSILGILPLFHALAQVANLMLPLTVGARILFLETVSSTEMLRALAEQDMTAFCCVPQFYYLIHQRVTQQVASRGWPVRVLFRLLLALNRSLRRAVGLNLGRHLFRRVHRALGLHMRILVSGGSRLDPKVGRALYDLGFNIVQAYGLTECAGAATVAWPGDIHVESVGPPMAGVEIRILDSGREGTHDRDVADGEVLIRGPIVMPGYHNRPDANAETLHDGWLHTGDLGYLDAHGRLHITGRMKEVIVLANGKNIYPEEVEAHYAQSPFIKDICVIGVSRPDEPAADRLHAIVVPNGDLLRERKVVNTTDLLRFEIESQSIRLPPHKRVLSFDVWLDDLPRTTTRKLKRFEIERMYVARQTRSAVDAAPQPWSEDDQVWASDPAVAVALGTIGAAAKPGARVAPDANLDLDLGLDSMERVELLTSLEHQFGTDVPDEVAQRVYTVRELVEAVLPHSDAAGAGGHAPVDPWLRLLSADPDDPALRAMLAPKPVFTAFAFVVMKAVGAAARVLGGLRVSGRHHIPAEGAFLISPNHQSYLDVFLMVGALPFRTFRRMFFVGASEYFETRVMRWTASRFNVVPVDPDANLVRAMQAGAFGLRRGRVLILFPEGERSPDGTVKKFKKGAAILSLQLGVPIVPVAIEGVFEIWPRRRSLNWRALLPGRGTRAFIEFGAPLSPGGAEAAGAEDRYSRLTERLRETVSAMWTRLRRARLGEP